MSGVGVIHAKETLAYRDIESFRPDKQHTSANKAPAVFWVVCWPDISTQLSNDLPVSQSLLTLLCSQGLALGC